MYSLISGGTSPLEIPAKSFKSFKLTFSKTDNFLIIFDFGAVRFSFSISFKYDAAIPIF